MADAAEETVTLNRWRIVVAVVGFGFVAWNLFYVRQSTRAALVAASAAEKATFEVEAPFLYPEVVWNSIGRSFHSFIVGDHLRSVNAPVNLSIGVAIKNYGRGPAIFQGWSVYARSFPGVPDKLDFGSLRPADQPIIEAGVAIPPPGFAEPGPGAFPIQIEPALDTAGVNRILSGEDEIILWGQFSFIGAHGASYIQTFGLRWIQQSQRFVPLSAQYNKRNRRTTEVSKRWWEFWK